MRDWFRLDRNRTAVRMIEQSENVKKGALTAAGRSNHRMHAAGLELQSDTAQSVHARFVFAEIALDVFAGEKRSAAVHTLEPRKVETGGRLAARCAGT